jgi:hypothetical protein
MEKMLSVKSAIDIIEIKLAESWLVMIS